MFAFRFTHYPRPGNRPSPPSLTPQVKFIRRQAGLGDRNVGSMEQRLVVPHSAPGVPFKFGVPIPQLLRVTPPSLQDCPGADGALSPGRGWSYIALWNPYPITDSGGGYKSLFPCLKVGQIPGCNLYLQAPCMIWPEGRPLLEAHPCLNAFLPPSCFPGHPVSPGSLS